MKEDEDYNRRLRDALVRRAVRARKDPRDFFEFTMREETTRARLTAAAHQRLFFRFVMDHPRCVVRAPPGFSKTYCTIALGLFLLGQDPTQRGAVISASREQASKPVAAMRDIIEHAFEIYPELLLTFPDLKQSTRPNDPWSGFRFTVERPPGIRDPSVAAYGEDSTSITGSRLSWIVVDDILNLENTLTKEARDATKKWFMMIVRTRLDPVGGRCIVTNTPWDEDDLTYYLEAEGWATLTMDAFGGVSLANVDPSWDCEEIRPAQRPSRLGGEAFRLAAHDAKAYGAPLATRDLSCDWRWFAEGDEPGPVKPGETQHFDANETIPLWPERFSLAKLREIENDMRIGSAAFASNYRMLTTSAADRRCDPAWVDACKATARRAGHHVMQKRWEPFMVPGRFGQPEPFSFTVMGVDIGGLGLQKDSDRSSLFTIETFMHPMTLSSGEVLRAGTQRVLDVKVGRWKPGELVRLIVETARAFQCRGVRVEKNAEESLLGWLEEIDAMLPVSGHHTGMNKHHVIFGVESVFLAMEKGLWLIPNVGGQVEEPVKEWLEDVRVYRPPPAHTGDVLMSSWFALEESRSLWTPPLAGLPASSSGSIAAALGAR